MKYTALILRPDYIASEFGKDTFLAFVEALSVEEAQAFARDDAKVADGYSLDPGDADWVDPTDYHLLFVCKGHHDNLATE